MCPGNRAEATTFWINYQIKALWELSVKCAKTHCEGIKPSRTDVTHGTCLAQFGVGKHRSKPATEDLNFFAKFAAPKFTFICNHDVLIQFVLEHGHLRYDSKGTCENFNDYTCAFRVPFRQHTITDTTLFTSGQVDTCKAKFLILDLENAMWVREHSGFAAGHKLDYDEVDRKQRAIVKYLKSEYISILRKSGFHFIQSLPDFDNLSRSHHIDWSVVTDIEIDALSVYEVNVETLNTHLKSRWLEHAGCVDELEDDHDHSQYGHYALAEHRAACDDFHFHAFFGPPQIRVLCSREVIFFVDVQDLHFYLDGGFTGEPHHKFSGWKIAIVVDVHHVVEEGGNIKHLKLDFTKARFCHSLSHCHRITEIEEALFIRLQAAFTLYITTRYLLILEEYRHSHIYRIDIRVHEEEVEYDEIDIDISFDEYRERLCITNTFGFDCLTTITQSCINYHLRCLWKASESCKDILSHWHHDSYFDAIFGAPQIELPCSNSSDSVILYVTMREGFLTCLGRLKKLIGGERHGFSSWRLAFEVKLRSRQYTKACPTSDYLKGYDSVGDYVNYQLYLDFGTAKFRQDLSRLPGLYDDTHYLLMRSKRQALVHYMTHFYLAELRSRGYHVLYTVPVWKPNPKSIRCCGITPFAPTTFHYQFYSGSNAVSGLFGHNRAFGNRNMIVICGMRDSHKRPSFPLPECSWRWTSSEDIFCGTVSLSRRMFLEEWLLVEFKRINRRTTLIPRFGGIEHHGKWNFRLDCLNDIDDCRTCEWREISCHETHIEFEHRNKDTWTFEHQSDCEDIHNGFYSVCCETVNSLYIPTVSKHGVCEIKISGKVSLRLEFKGEFKSWSTSAVATWTSSIFIANGERGCGLRISSSSSHEISEGLGFCGDSDIVHEHVKDARTLLEEQLHKFIIIEETTIGELKSCFSQVWPLLYSGTHGYTLCNAVFNSCGDIIFELDSPIDHYGQVIVTGRKDICGIPTRKDAPYRSSSFFQKAVDTVQSVVPRVYGANSTTSTVYDSPVKTPANGHTGHYEPPKVVTKDAYPGGSYEEDHEEDHEDHEGYGQEGYETHDKPHFEDSEFDFNRASGLTV